MKDVLGLRPAGAVRHNLGMAGLVGRDAAVALLRRHADQARAGRPVRADRGRAGHRPMASWNEAEVSCVGSANNI
jgi:hypothetical protein